MAGEDKVQDGNVAQKPMSPLQHTQDATLPEDLHELNPLVQNSADVARDVEQNSLIRPAEDGDQDDAPRAKRPKQEKKQRGQNKARKFANSKDEVRLCSQIARGESCTFEGDCKYSHSLKDYINTKPPDIGPECPIYSAIGHCDAGFRCRWLTGHVEKPDVADPDSWKLLGKPKQDLSELCKTHKSIENILSRETMQAIRKKAFRTSKSDAYLKYLSDLMASEEKDAADKPDVPFRPSEKRSLDWSNTKILAPLTTTGNMPFRQICREYGADVTYSEMALSVPLLSGSASEWALTRSHQAERDMRNGRRGIYGIQIAGSKPAMVVPAAEMLATEFESTLDFVDLNCGCPIDLVFKQGAGSALLDNHGRLLKMLKGMSLVTGDVPVTVKVRTGVKDKCHTSGKLLARLNADACVSMVTLHGRSRAQRYSRPADWEYIASCAASIKAYQAQAAGEDLRGKHAEYGYSQKLAFVGNGDVYTFEDWNRNMQSGVDGCMIARGALIKPWIFEEIDKQQHLDKSASERLAMLDQYCKNGLACWGADQMGVDKTRRFLLEFMSFHHRYVPSGVLAAMGEPIQMGDRPPAWTPRNEDEKLLASMDCADWVKISERFLGKAAESFKFVPKHKANSVNAEG
ncbi:hypothetical protein BCR37DRAFT_376374 [Protomyces lactucae-debilis]|uniref:tRNA-dihydrouridine(47) synthase [NAD(P)(+)] n=1 Tax=Protomyces lactucae-debilis TaxID=2754530 RepID=A0A1Y2FSN8_PROLT|nr:uncharacterized protein BCR37DRAFT_376374 [Protomyces lactucae-debilis]ORY87020.1 hypothetical protein BCR37DRAFT_376374 [Protomyces lactucae-debilis]